MLLHTLSPLFAVLLFLTPNTFCARELGMRWQRWAIYKRSLQKDIFRFNVEDYIKQSLQHCLRKAALESPESSVEAIAREVLAEKMVSEGENGVRQALTAYYSALNRKHIDDLCLFFLPDDESEVAYPGFGKAVSANPNLQKSSSACLFSLQETSAASITCTVT